LFKELPVSEVAEVPNTIHMLLVLSSLKTACPGRYLVEFNILKDFLGEAFLDELAESGIDLCHFLVFDCGVFHFSQNAESFELVRPQLWRIFFE
jgi:hypothetical protein